MSERQCGDCTLCCKLVPVVSLDKGAGVRCKHQRFGKGCAVYHKRTMPVACSTWNCRWIVNDDTADLSRPDRSHYVIDVLPDFITITRDGEDPTQVQVVQVWCDPKFPNAHRDPKLRSFLERRARDNIAAIIRYNETDAVVLFPPYLSSDRQWHEVATGCSGPTHSPLEVADVLNEIGATSL